MVSDAYRTFGSRKKWYVFIEADTYLSTYNLLLWLTHLDHQRSVYAGAQVMIGNTEFAHGGSGFLLSSSAGQALASGYRERHRHWEEKLAFECCGDKLMAEVLLAADPPTRLLRSFPSIQGETVASLDWSPTHWCAPAVTWHHVDAAGIDKLWRFEQDWRKSNGPRKPILFADYYAAFVHPRIVAANGTLQDWDNLSDGWTFERGKIIDPSYESVEACEQSCRDNPSCLQWAWCPGMCRAGRAVKLGWALSNRPALGSAEDRIAKTGNGGNAGVVSGWLLDRIETFRTAMEPCAENRGWATHGK